MHGGTDLSEPSLANDGIGSIGEIGKDKKNQHGLKGGIVQRQCSRQWEESTLVIICNEVVGGQVKTLHRLTLTHKLVEDLTLG